LQEWEAKAVEDRKRYEREFAEWKASGGQEAMDQVKNVIKTVRFFFVTNEGAE
jgi:hypothetical protein